jgi:hypothetical protein
MFLMKRCQIIKNSAFACPAAATHPLRPRDISSLVYPSNKTEAALAAAEAKESANALF